jgi:hypothetical protein
MENSGCLLNVDKDRECLLNDKNKTVMQQNGKYRAEYIDVAAQRDRFWKFRHESFAAFGVVKESRRSDDLVADKLLKGNNDNNNEAACPTALCLTTTCQKAGDVTSQPEVS